MAELPSGTVTLLFTDIEGSTRLVRLLGDRWAEALADHRRVLREAAEAAGGEEVDAHGDELFLTFPAPAAAVAAARAAQLRLDRHPWPGEQPAGAHCDQDRQRRQAPPLAARRRVALAAGPQQRLDRLPHPARRRRTGEQSLARGQCQQPAGEGADGGR